jgi:hypothetical protein
VVSPPAKEVSECNLQFPEVNSKKGLELRKYKDFLLIDSAPGTR